MQDKHNINTMSLKNKVYVQNWGKSQWISHVSQFIKIFIFDDTALTLSIYVTYFNDILYFYIVLVQVDIWSVIIGQTTTYTCFSQLYYKWTWVVLFFCVQNNR